MARAAVSWREQDAVRLFPYPNGSSLRIEHGPESVRIIIANLSDQLAHPAAKSPLFTDQCL